MYRMALGQTVFQYFGFPLLLYGNVIKIDNGAKPESLPARSMLFRKIVSSGFKGYNTIVLLPCLPQLIIVRLHHGKYVFRVVRP
jgi:hypothetical protein